MTRDLEHILTEFDDEDDESRKKKKEPTVESIIDSAFDEETLAPGNDESLPSGEEYRAEDIPAEIDQEFPPVTAGEHHEDAAAEPAAETIQTEDEEQPGPRETDEAAPRAVIDIPGTRSWNTRPPYVLPIDAALLESDMSSLEKSFFVTEGNLQGEELSTQLKRALLRYLKKQHPQAAGTFSEVVNRIILRECENLAGHFALDPDKEKIFIYHLGPLTMDSILQSRLKKEGTGYCYIYGTDGKATRFFPESFLKRVVTDWYRNNIYDLGLPFDSLEIFDSLKTIVSRRYMDEEREFRSRLEKINMKVDPSRRITAETLMRLKGGEWYDPAVVMTYKRFLGRTIFG